MALDLPERLFTPCATPQSSKKSLRLNTAGITKKGLLGGPFQGGHNYFGFCFYPCSETA